MDRLVAMQAFVAVAEAGGFALAARRLGIAAPAVTKRIAQLEAHLGVRLLARTTRSVRLTDEGALYLTACTRILAEVAEAEAATPLPRRPHHPLIRLAPARPMTSMRRCWRCSTASSPKSMQLQRFTGSCST